MKKRFLILSILALTSLSLKANCGKADCACDPCLCPAPTPCCYPSSWYIATRGALTWHNNLKFNTNIGLGTFHDDYKIGGGANFAIGYNFQCIPMRFEIEGLYQRNNRTSTKLTNVPAFLSALGNTSLPATGSVQDFALMANLYYDFNLCSCLKFYLGGGIGIDFNRLRFSTVFIPGSGEVSDASVLRGLIPFFPALNNLISAENNTLFAWNAMAGFSYPITQCFYLDLGYRIWGTTGIPFNPSAGFKKSNLPLVQRAEAGFRYNF